MCSKFRKIRLPCSNILFDRRFCLGIRWHGIFGWFAITCLDRCLLDIKVRIMCTRELQLKVNWKTWPTSWEPRPKFVSLIYYHRTSVNTLKRGKYVSLNPVARIITARSVVIKVNQHYLYPIIHFFMIRP